jgi:hypothetical protein
MDWKILIFGVLGLIVLGAIFSADQDLCESYGFTKGTPQYVGCQWEVVNDLPVTRP